MFNKQYSGVKSAEPPVDKKLNNSTKLNSANKFPSGVLFNVTRDSLQTSHGPIHRVTIVNCILLSMTLKLGENRHRRKHTLLSNTKNLIAVTIIHTTHVRLFIAWTDDKKLRRGAPAFCLQLCKKSNLNTKMNLEHYFESVSEFSRFT